MQFTEIAGCSFTNKRATNEDFYLARPNCLFVFDGHGGFDISEGLRDHFLQCNFESLDQIQIEIYNFEDTFKDDDLIKQVTIGSTFVCCLLRNEKLHVLNVGDSFCFTKHFENKLHHPDEEAERL